MVVALRETLLEKPNEFFVSRRDYFTLLLAVVVSLIFIFNSSQPQIEAVRSWLVDQFAYLQRQISWYRGLIGMSEETARLRLRATELMLENSALREALLENHRLRRLLAFKEREPRRVVSARVIAKREHALSRELELDVGRRHGVAPNMAVVTPAGLAGKILDARENTSTMQVIENLNFKASARVQRSRVFGIVEFQESEGLLLNSVAKKSNVGRGDVVVTSEISSIFPEGIRIGMVEEIKKEKPSLFMDITLTPAVAVSQLEEVFVVVATPREDLPSSVPPSNGAPADSTN